MIPGLEYESASFDNGNGSSSSAPDHHHHHHQQQQQYPSSNDYGGASSSPASSVNSYSSINLDTPSYSSATAPSGGYPELRRRQVCNNNNNNNNGYAGSTNYDTASYSKGSKSSSVTKLAAKLDVFPKTERDYTVRTERGGQLSAIGYAIMLILILAEYETWKSMNGDHNEHIVVDTR